MGGVLACFKLIRSLSSSCAVGASLSVRGALKKHRVPEEWALVRLPKLQAESLGQGLPLMTAAAIELHR